MLVPFAALHHLYVVCCQNKIILILIVFAIYVVSSTVTLASTNTFPIIYYMQVMLCFYHIRDLRRIRRHIPLSTGKTISNALISSRLDYCNSLINNIAKQDLSKLQRLPNCLARVVLRAPRFSPSLPLLKQLHWLPVNYRIKFNLSTLTDRALAIHQPPYLAGSCTSNIPRQLRSSTSQQLSIPRTKLNLVKRAFSVAAPIIWNELPTTLKYCESLASFHKNLKTSSKLLFHLK